jgi:hypothetical protein
MHYKTSFSHNILVRVLLTPVNNMKLKKKEVRNTETGQSTKKGEGGVGGDNWQVVWSS